MGTEQAVLDTVIYGKKDNYLIRPVSADEMGQMTELGREFYQVATSAPGNFDAERTTTFLSECVRTQQGVVIAAWLDGHIVGGVVGFLVQDLFSDTLALNELAWYVRPEHRSHGLGEGILGAFEQWGRERCANVIRMAHLSESMAKSLRRYYKNNGYKQSETLFVKDLIYDD